MTCLLSCVVVVCVLVGCGSRPPDYFPLKPRTQRVMEVRERRVVGAETTSVIQVEIIETIKGMKDIPGIGRAWVVEAPFDSGRTVNYYYVQSADSILMVVPGRGGRPERVLYLLLSLRPGLRWYDSDEKREINEVVAQETVRVPAGTFAGCFRVVQRSLRVDNRVEKWLAPDVGLVKRVRHLSWSDDSLHHTVLREERLVEYRVAGRRK